MAVPVYDGEFSEREASRLLWRAGFGPKPGEAKKLANKGLSKAVNSLLNPPKAKLIGPEPHDDDGNFAPVRPLRPRRHVVARQDGALEPAAGRADGAQLARLVRDGRRRARYEDLDRPGEHVP